MHVHPGLGAAGLATAMALFGCGNVVVEPPRADCGQNAGSTSGTGGNGGAQPDAGPGQPDGGEAGPPQDAEPCTPEPVWRQAAAMTYGRGGPTATLLSTGQVVIAGGIYYHVDPLADIELYDPIADTWTFGAPMSTARSDATATMLGSGKVLMAGGVNGSGKLATAELYDPTAGTWTAAAAMKVARIFHTATLLQDGTVLVVGGGDWPAPYASVEVYDPDADTWKDVTPLNTARGHHTATLLPDGKVLVAGGTDSSDHTASVEIYDPVTSVWTVGESMTEKRSIHMATLLSNGEVLVTGGSNLDMDYVASLKTAERYNPSTGLWTPAALMGQGRRGHTATRLATGTVLVTGGMNDEGSSFNVSAEIYDPQADTWLPAPPMGAERVLHTATLLNDGTVLVAGGDPPQRSSLSNVREGTFSHRAHTVHARHLGAFLGLIALLARKLCAAAVHTAAGDAVDCRHAELTGPQPAATAAVALVHAPTGRVVVVLVHWDGGAIPRLRERA